MKNGYILKDVSYRVSTNDDLKLINNYTRRNFKSDEIYIFSVVLCDNEIDRENECFSKDSLDKLAVLFLGKTGIFDHNAKSKNQNSRIFSCKVENVSEKVTSYGEPYYRLVAKAYIPRLEKNNDFILEIDSGIKKEVSISCNISNMICSICSSNYKLNPCRHIKGRKYLDDQQICYIKLEDPKDAYEWSFVAVPAQKNAGVIKSFHFNEKGGAFSMNAIIKEMSLGKEVLLNSKESIKFFNFISELKEEAEQGKIYKEDLRKEVLRLYLICQPNLDTSIVKSVAQKMTLKELKAFKKSFENQDKLSVKKPQLSSQKISNQKTLKQNTEFKI